MLKELSKSEKRDIIYEIRELEDQIKELEMMLKAKERRLKILKIAYDVKNGDY